MNIDEIEKRAKASTADEIDINRFDNDDGSISYQLQGDAVLGYFNDGDGNTRAKFDAIFFAHAREDVLALIERIRELEAERCR